MIRTLLFITLLLSSLFAEETSRFIDIQNEKTIESLTKHDNTDFGLEPHYVNYLLPYGYTDAKYKAYGPSEDYRHYEAELQISLKLKIAKNFFKLHESYYLAYSHKAFWQLYSESSPFRETNYNPEGFVVFPISDKESIFSLQALTLGVAHISNGQGVIDEDTVGTDYPYPLIQSRSLNYVYTKLSMQHGSLMSDVRVILPFGNKGDNPDIMDYRGYFDAEFRYFYEQHLFALSGNYSFRNGKGSVTTSYSYPLASDVNIYAKIFSGYGESLIDYDNFVRKYSIGFSFSR
jgi:phospholipase A1